MIYILAYLLLSFVSSLLSIVGINIESRLRTFELVKRLSNFSNVKVSDRTQRYVLLTNKNEQEEISYSIILSSDTTKIIWNYNSKLYGKHELEWGFKKKRSQIKMFNRIKKDLKEYESNLEKN